MFLFFSKSLIFGQSYNNLTCEPRAYLVEENYQLPYKYDRISISNGSTVLKPGDTIIYSFRLNNNTPIKNQQIKKVNLKHIMNEKEPISILDVKPINGDCKINENNKSVFCLLDYYFNENADDPIYYKIKINSDIQSFPKTSSLFTIQTNVGITECAVHFWLKDDQKPNKVNWETPFASFSSSDFYIRIQDKKFYGQEPIYISSNPGIDKTTLEATWKENNVEMRLFMYFRLKNNKEWEMYQLSSYNGKNPGDWIFYNLSSDKPISGFLGDQNYFDEKKFFPRNGENAEIFCRSCSINAFLNKIATPYDKDYLLEPVIGLPKDKIITINNDPMTAYGVTVILKDKTGNIVDNQSDFFYQWSVSSPNIVSLKIGPIIDENNNCWYGIKKPCPENYVNIFGINPGRVEIKAEVLRKTDKSFIASTSFPVIVTNKDNLTSFCANEGEVIKKDSLLRCCNDLILIPPIDDRIDIFGTCLKPCYSDSDCQSGKICRFARNNQLVCLSSVIFNDNKNNTTEDIEKIKQEINQIKKEQNVLKSMLDSILSFLRRLFKF